MNIGVCPLLQFLWEKNVNQRQWKIFTDFKTEYKAKIKEWGQKVPDLMTFQMSAAKKAKTPDYSFENPVVYNTDLDKITVQDDIKLIVIGDNPGKDEQLTKNQRYLCGQAGKIAEGYFKKNPELGVDFRKNVIILNKTPVHSAKTNQLKTMMKEGGKSVENLILETQMWMAQKTAKLHCDLCAAAGVEDFKPELWLVGYSELKGKGFFIPYRDELKKIYETDGNLWWNNVYVFQHFSMNRFTIDLSEYCKSEHYEKRALMENIHDLGQLHKQEIFYEI